MNVPDRNYMTFFLGDKQEMMEYQDKIDMILISYIYI